MNKDYKSLLNSLKFAMVALTIGIVAASVWADKDKSAVSIILAVLCGVGLLAAVIAFYILHTKQEKRERAFREKVFENTINVMLGKENAISDEELLENEKNPLLRVELIAKIAAKKRLEEEAAAKAACQAEGSSTEVTTPSEATDLPSEATESMEEKDKTEQSPPNE